MTLEMELVAGPSVPWDELDTRSDRVVTQTRAWLDFLAETQRAEPVTARVLDAGQTVGWFTGAVVRRAGFRVLGSPLRGWTTTAMGFNLEPGVDRTAALAALPAFAFRQLGCIHLEFADRGITDRTALPPGFEFTPLRGYELDLVDDDRLLAGMSSSGRRNVRKGERNGITVEVVDHADPHFAAEYYDQVSQAFAKRGVVPTYPVERIDALMRHLGPTGHLLLLRARTAHGEPAATGIFPGLEGSVAEFAFGGSAPVHQRLYPNEVLMWAALREWRDRGATRFNFGGGGYKAKYGGTDQVMPWVRRSRFGALEHGRKAALSVYRLRRRRRG